VVLDVRARYPRARFTVATLASNAPLARDLADTLLTVRPTGVLSAGADLLRAALRLRQGPPDLALDFEPFARAGALLARLGGAKQRLGFATGRGARDGLYTVTVPFRKDAHAGRSFRDLAEAAGVPAGAYCPGALAATEAGRAAASRVAPPRPYVVLHPGSGDNFPGRRWSEAGFAAVGRAAVAEGARVVVTGQAAEVPLAARVAAGSGPDAVVAAGRLDLEGLVALLAGARALVSNDTGPVHLASALGVPTLAIFGPNTPVLYGPLARGSRAFYRALPCSPCLTAASYRGSRCRIFACMAAIPTGEVVAALRRLLVNGPSPSLDPAPCPPATNG
jgi:ADP-heptose:LPS heptosyltransferase